MHLSTGRPSTSAPTEGKRRYLAMKLGCIFEFLVLSNFTNNYETAVVFHLFLDSPGNVFVPKSEASLELGVATHDLTLRK